MAEKSDIVEKNVENVPSEEEQVPSSSGAAWGWGLGSWIDTAKKTSASVFEAVKNDLTELSSAVKTEASNAAHALEHSLSLNEPDSTVGVMKKSFSSFIGQVTEALVPSMEEDEDTEAVMITHDGQLTLSGFYKHLAELQSNEKTFLDEPGQELMEKYNRWLEVIDQEQFTENRLARHLTSSTILNEMYLTLVPQKVAHMEFWKRYLFKKALLEDAHAHAEMAERKAKCEIDSTKTVSPETVVVQTEQPRKINEGKWEEVPEIDSTNIELSEEEQARLLEEYEQEIREREKSLKVEEKTPTNSPKKTPNDKTQQATKGQQELKMEKNHFTKEEISSSNSEESWEKDFDLEDQ